MIAIAADVYVKLMSRRQSDVDVSMSCSCVHRYYRLRVVYNIYGVCIHDIAQLWREGAGEGVIFWEESLLD